MHRDYIRILLFILILIFIAQKSHSEILLDTIIVKNDDESIDDIIKESPGSVTVIDKRDIENNTNSLSALLEKVTGVTIQKYNDENKYSTISLRGFESKHIIVVIDGITENNPVEGEVNLADISLENIKRIEIYKGMSPEDFGSESLGSVINIITDNEYKNQFNIKTDIGSFGYKKIFIDFGYKINNHDISISNNFTHSNGNYRFLNDNGTWKNLTDDRIETRTNNNLLKDKIDLRYRYLNQNFKLSLKQNFFMKDEGIPGIGHNQSLYSRYNQWNYTINLDFIPYIKTKYIKDNNFKLYYSISNSIYNDTHGELYYQIPAYTQDKIQNAAIKQNSEIRVNNHNIISINNMIKTTIYNHDDLLEDTAAKNNYRYKYRVSLEDNVSIITDLSIYLKYIFEYNKTVFNEPVILFTSTILNDKTYYKSQFHLGLNYSILKNFIVKYNIGNYHRIPFFYEIFGDGRTLLANSELKPETSINTELSLVYKTKYLYLDSAIFYNDVNNLIYWIYSNNKAQARNISNSQIYGFESGLTLYYKKYFTLRNSIAYLNPRDKGIQTFYYDKILPGKYPLILKSELKISYSFIECGYEFSYYSESYLDRANLTELEQRMYHNIYLAYTYKKLRIIGEVMNVGNNTNRDYPWNPVPGRKYKIRLSYSL